MVSITVCKAIDISGKQFSIYKICPQLKIKIFRKTKKDAIKLLKTSTE